MPNRLFLVCRWALCLLSVSLVPFLDGCDRRTGPRGTVAFIRAGDVWVMTLSTGRLARITEDGANSSPLLSPSGAWIAWRGKGGELRLARTDGSSPLKLHDGAERIEARWAPARDLLAFGTVAELRVMRAGGDAPTHLVSAPRCEGCSVRDFTWSPDGDWIAYGLEERRPVVKENDWPWQNTFMKVSPEGGLPVELYRLPLPEYSEETDEHSPGNAVLTRWTRSGLLYWQCEVMSASIMADGCPLHLLKPDGGRLELPVSLLYDDFLDLSPDGATLAMAEGGGRETWTGETITLVDLRSGASRAISGADSSSFTPAWSPDGESLAYVSGPAAGGDETSPHENRAVLESLAARRVWVSRRDGSETRRLTTDEKGREECPVWTPEGGGLLFPRLEPGGERPDTCSVSLWLSGAKGGPASLVAESLGPREGPADCVEYFGHLERGPYFDVAREPG